MQLATSINLYERRFDGGLYDPIESIDMLHQYGYKLLDMDLAMIVHRDFFLIKDDWERKCHEIAEHAASLGVTFAQCHIPFYNSGDINWFDPAKHEWFEKMVERAYYAAGILGVKWATVHAFTDMENDCRPTCSKSMNLAYFAPYIELAKKLNVGISIENMADFYKSPCRRRYSVSADELVDLVDTIHDPMVGITWDTGHANIQGYRQQSKQLKVIGSRLTSLHINDNHGVQDIHTLPFLGNVDWQDVMTALRDIDYKGELTYETHGFTNPMPEALKPEGLRLSVLVGHKLLEMAK
ncbi:MAG: sugar phosphate isomerase/epimerase family protein [Angelakisella sp.]